MSTNSHSPERVKHLELIQSVISRMANNSFLLKGWSVTIVAGLFAVGTNDGDFLMVILAVLPISAFWYLDAFYLRQERLFRRVYDKALLNEVELFALSTEAYKCDVHGVITIMWAECNRYFYGVLLLIALFFSLLVYGSQRVLQLPLRQGFVESRHCQEFQRDFKLRQDLYR